MIKIKRNTGIMGIIGSLMVYITGEKIDNIKANKQIELKLPKDQATIKVSQLGSTSNELLVQDGETVEITTTDSTYIGLFVSIILISTLNTYLSSPYNIILPILFAILYICSYLFYLNVFELKTI